MASSVSVGRRVRAGVLTWSLLAFVVSVNGQRSLGQNGQVWAGKRVITKFVAVLRADDQVAGDGKLENAARGGSRNRDHVYRIAASPGQPWRNTTRRSPTTARPFASNPRGPMPTSIAPSTR